MTTICLRFGQWGAWKGDWMEGGLGGEVIYSPILLFAKLTLSDCASRQRKLDPHISLLYTSLPFRMPGTTPSSCPFNLKITAPSVVTMLLFMDTLYPHLHR